MSTEFLTIKECVDAKKGSFIGVIIKQGDLKSGTSNGKDWTKKNFTVQDSSTEIELTAWGEEEIKQFKIGNKYQFVNPWWKLYKDQVTMALGKYADVKLIGTATEQTTIPEQSKGVDFKKMSEQAESEKETKPEATSLPEIGPNLAVFSEEQCIQLLQIEKVVKETMSKFEPTKIHEGQKVGMHVKEIYRESKKFKFEKASET